MKEMYFDTEVTFTDPKIIEALRSGQRVAFDSSKVKIITIQYQLLKPNGKPDGPLQVFKEWESTEEQVIKKMWNLLNPRTLWDFAPVGYNIHFDLAMLKIRGAAYGINYPEWYIYHDLPTIDIKGICLGMNAFNFKDSGLDKFTGKKTSGAMVPVWYHDGDYEKIMEYIRNETEEFIGFYARLKEIMPKVREQYGFNGLKSK